MIELPELTHEELANADALPETDLPMTMMSPHAAIQQAIFDLCYKRADWQQRDDPNGVLPWLIERIACLEQAQRELAELREIKKALAVLKGAL